MQRVTLYFIISFLLLFISSEQTFAHLDTLKKKSFSFPNQQGWVNDFEYDLDSVSKNILIDMAKQHQLKTSNQICIITIANPDEDFAEFTIGLANFWGIGEKVKNNGVLIALSKKQRKVHIATGFGVENILTDALCKKVIDDKMTPKFRSGDYAGGLIDGMKELIALLEKTN